MAIRQSRIYSIMASFQNVGERIFFTFAALYADTRGATTAQQGLMLSLQNILAFIGQNFFGKASDGVGRPIIIITGYLVSILAAFLIFNFTNPLIIILIFAFYNIGFSMVQPAFYALLGDTAAYEKIDRSTLLGTVSSFASLAGGIIYLTTGLISDRVGNTYQFLFITAGICFASAGFVITMLHLRHRIPPRAPNGDRKGLSFLDPLKNERFRRFVLIDALFALAMSTTWPLFPKVTNQLATTAQVTLIWFATFLCFSITARQTKRIKEFIGSYHKSLFVSRFILFLVPVVFAFATSWIHILMVRILAGTSFGFYSVLQKDYILETSSALGRDQDRGWFIGSHSFVWGIFTFFGSLTSGLVAEWLIKTIPGISFMHLFLGTALLRFITVFGFLLVPAIVYEKK